MDQVFGSSPKVDQQPNVSVLNPTQLALQSILAGQYSSAIPGMLSNVEHGSPAIGYNDPFAAAVTPQEGGLISDIIGAGTTGPAAGTLNTAQQALEQVLSGQPQDFSQYFQNDIATPLENTFSQRTLPALKAAFARSAGGNTSTGPNTGYSAAVGQATQDLGQQLQASDTALGTQAITTAMNNRVSGLSMAPGLASSFLNNLTTGLSAADLYRQVQQAQLSGQANWAQTGLNFLSGLTGQGNQISSVPTIQQGNTVVNPGNPGLIAPLLGGLGQGLGMLGGAFMMSDPRLKDIEEEDNKALSVIKKLTVKKAKYKWEPKGHERQMLMADNVERVYPKAAGKIAGYGAVNTKELIPLLVRGIQELSKKAA